MPLQPSKVSSDRRRPSANKWSKNFDERSHRGGAIFHGGTMLYDTNQSATLQLAIRSTIIAAIDFFGAIPMLFNGLGNPQNCSCVWPPIHCSLGSPGSTSNRHIDRFSATAGLTNVTNSDQATPSVAIADRVKVLRPNRHKVGHFGDVLPSQSLGLVLNCSNRLHLASYKFLGQKCACRHTFDPEICMLVIFELLVLIDFNIIHQFVGNSYNKKQANYNYCHPHLYNGHSVKTKNCQITFHNKPRRKQTMLLGGNK